MKLVSFELGAHDYVLKGKNYIDNTYPFRHRLILGDSLESVPLFHRENLHVKFDFIFIDGNHSYEHARADLLHCRQLAHPRSIVIMDDTRLGDEVQSYNLGPNKAWAEFVGGGFVKELGAENYKSIPPSPCSRGQSWGTYVF